MQRTKCLCRLVSLFVAVVGVHRWHENSIDHMDHTVCRLDVCFDNPRIVDVQTVALIANAEFCTVDSDDVTVQGCGSKLQKSLLLIMLRD